MSKIQVDIVPKTREGNVIHSLKLFVKRILYIISINGDVQCHNWIVSYCKLVIYSKVVSIYKCLFSENFIIFETKNRDEKYPSEEILHDYNSIIIITRTTTIDIYYGVNVVYQTKGRMMIYPCSWRPFKRPNITRRRVSRCGEFYLNHSQITM